jgi:hypothetical protein
MRLENSPIKVTVHEGSVAISTAGTLSGGESESWAYTQTTTAALCVNIFNAVLSELLVKRHLTISAEMCNSTGNCASGEGGRTGNNAWQEGAGVWVCRLTLTGLFSCRLL